MRSDPEASLSFQNGVSAEMPPRCRICRDAAEGGGGTCGDTAQDNKGKGLAPVYDLFAVKPACNLQSNLARLLKLTTIN